MLEILQNGIQGSQIPLIDAFNVILFYKYITTMLINKQNLQINVTLVYSLLYTTQNQTFKLARH